MAFGILSLFVIAGIVIIVPVILICVVLAGKRNKAPATAASQPEAETVNPEARNQRRETILGQLAKKEISREEAEKLLLELDNPLPRQMPTTPPPKSGCGSGCLIAIICGLVAGVILILLLMSLLFVSVETTSSEYEVQVEEMRKAQIEEMRR